MSRFPATTELASGPPSEVLAEIDVAWERARELFGTGMGLHFKVGRRGVWAERRLADGTFEGLRARHGPAVCCGGCGVIARPARAMVATCDPSLLPGAATRTACCGPSASASAS